MKRVFLQKVFMECVNYFENWLVGLPHTDSIGQKKKGKLEILYRFFVCGGMS